MAMPPKKKISFDLEPALIEDIKEITNTLKIKQSDFLRSAVYNYIFKASEYIFIYEINNNTIQKKSINVFDIKNVENKEVSKDLILLGFASTGKIHFKKGDTISFLSLYEITNKTIENLKNTHYKAKEQLLDEIFSLDL